jgi:hypothetical protein
MHVASMAGEEGIPLIKRRPKAVKLLSKTQRGFDVVGVPPEREVSSTV